MHVTGRVVKYGDDINTDIIIPGRYLVLTDPDEMAKHAMEGVDPDFPAKSRGGVVVVAGEGFGSGSSREQAPIALKYADVKCIIAKSFARIFYRNAINIGLPVLESRDVWEHVDEGDRMTIDLARGLVRNHTKETELLVQPLPDFILELLNEGGLLNRLKKLMKVQSGEV